MVKKFTVLFFQLTVDGLLAFSEYMDSVNLAYIFKALLNKPSRLFNVMSHSRMVFFRFNHIKAIVETKNCG